MGDIDMLILIDATARKIEELNARVELLEAELKIKHEQIVEKIKQTDYVVEGNRTGYVNDDGSIPKCISWQEDIIEAMELYDRNKTTSFV